MQRSPASGSAAGSTGAAAGGAAGATPEPPSASSSAASLPSNWSSGLMMARHGRQEPRRGAWESRGSACGAWRTAKGGHAELSLDATPMEHGGRPSGRGGGLAAESGDRHGRRGLARPQGFLHENPNRCRRLASTHTLPSSPLFAHLQQGSVSWGFRSALHACTGVCSGHPKSRERGGAGGLQARPGRGAHAVPPLFPRKAPDCAWGGPFTASGTGSGAGRGSWAI